MTRCAGCEEPLTADDDVRLDDDEGLWHDECWYNEFEYASTVWLMRDGKRQKLLVVEHGVYDGDTLEEYDGPYRITRSYRGTVGGGYYETTVHGLERVQDGWTTGNWGDAISDDKQPFNEWAQALIDGDEYLPDELTVAIVYDLTSNVFATSVTVFVNNESIVEELLEIPAL